LIRVLIIGTFSLAGDRLFTTDEHRAYTNQPRPVSTYQPSRPVNQPVLRPASSLNRPVNVSGYRPAPKPTPQQTSFVPPEPTYHPVSYGARNADENNRRFDA
jgi:hypothetical protein